MSKPTDYITHPGIVQSIETNRVQVMILTESACVSCKAKSVCSVADMKEKLIDVVKEPGRDYKIGDRVNVIMEKSLGPKAIFLGYLLPFLIVISVLFSLILTGFDQGISALIALGLLVPYYLTLYRMKDKLNKHFMFRIE